MPNLSEKELNVTLSKIRKDYETGAERYGEHAYNIMAFNDRYREALNSKQNLSNFLLAEIGVLEDIKYKLNEIEQQKQRRKEARESLEQNSFMNKVDDMIDRLESAIIKYPKKEIHERAEDEITHLYGAFDEFYSCFSVVRAFCGGRGNDYVVETALKDLDNRLQAFVMIGGGGKPPPVFADYAFVLNTSESASRSEQIIFKESGFLLHSLIKKLEDIRSAALRVTVDKDIVLPAFLKSGAPRVYSFFVGKTCEEIYDATIAYAKTMIVDFRLQSFKKNDD